MSTMKITPDQLSRQLRRTVEGAEKHVREEVKRRGYRASNEISSATQMVLTGKRHGRVYRIRHKKHIASAPGEAPAVSTGNLRLSFGRMVTEINDSGSKMTVNSSARSNVKYAGILDEGLKGGHIAARPYKEKALQKALPKVKKIYREPYR